MRITDEERTGASSCILPDEARPLISSIPETPPASLPLLSFLFHPGAPALDRRFVPDFNELLCISEAFSCPQRARLDVLSGELGQPARKMEQEKEKEEKEKKEKQQKTAFSQRFSQ